MTTATLTKERPGILRQSPWDALLVALAAAHGGLLIAVPALPVVALGLWWNSNTVAHHFIHRPFFRRRGPNRAFSIYLSLLLGIPQSLWRDRHLAHHAGAAWHARVYPQLLAEAVAVVALWTILAVLWPAFLLTAYLPGYLAGLALCWLHGHYEHARGTISHHGLLYNLLFFNDGYHVEHHAHPAAHWRRLPALTAKDTPTSRWPAVLRWLDLLSLESLERLVLRSGLLQRFVLSRHERAFRKLLAGLPLAGRVAIVGGGLFPRTLLVLRRLLPGAQFIVIDRSAANLETARTWLSDGVRLVHECYDPARIHGVDLLVIPLAFVGDREAVYREPPAPTVVLHDWIWRRRGTGAVVSWFLLKRLNLVGGATRCTPGAQG
jgi:hypothetical protein